MPALVTRSVWVRLGLALAVGAASLAATGSLSAAESSAPAAAPAPAPVKPAAAPPGKLLRIEVATAGDGRKEANLIGQDSRYQVLVTGVYEANVVRDLTRDVKYTALPAGVVTVDATGLVLPKADGQATLQVEGPDGTKAELPVRVTHFSDELPVNFPNQIVPVFTKYGCNAGGCHGKASGQNGFKLSLLGFEPGEDYEHLVLEGRGRRLFPAAPDESLLLRKAINASPHGGGQRLSPDDHDYRLVRRWIAQGMPFGDANARRVVRIDIYPSQRTMQRGSQQQVAVMAIYSDGSHEDVTRLAQYEPNLQEMAEVSPTGLVKTLDLAGDVAIMARYQGQVAVFRASIPLGAPVDKLPPERNFIDRLVFQKLKTLGIPPSEVCDDATFLRRVSIDLAGRLPTVDEVRAFLADTSPAKRDQLIDRLLASPEHADYFAVKWGAVLRNRRQRPTYARGTYGMRDWIWESVYTNKPYDQFVREILAASGEMSQNPPVSWYREVDQVDLQVEDTAQLFLGLRIQCAKCHHHPFEKWSQRDYYGFAAFFSRVGRKPGDEADEVRIYHKRGAAAAVNPKTGEQLKPTGLGGEPLALAPDVDPRQKLVDWMADPSNPHFAPALVNRYWKHLFARGIVEPEDDMRATNPASNPELLDALARHFVESKFDLRGLLRTMCQSTTYQLSAEPNQHNVSDKQNFSRYYPKRLQAEVLLDSIDTLTGAPSSFNGLPGGTRATQIPDNGVNSYFLTVFGRPEGASACECERSQDASLAQSLHLLNSSEVQGKLASGSGRAAGYAKDTSQPAEAKLRDLYLAAMGREPRPDELAVALAHVQKFNGKNPQQAYEDILWALLNTKEFLFNH